MIIVVGISHKSAPVNIRKLYSFDEAEKKKFAKQIKLKLRIEGIVILSTCNRTEIYFNTRIENESEAYNLTIHELFKFKKAINHNPEHFYFYSNAMAVEHLFRVTSGLDSMVLGEEQILGQVKEAFRSAQAWELTDGFISRLFIKAIEAGKRVHTETHISKGTASVSYAAVELCNELFPNLQNCTIMVIGAGQTGDLILQCLNKKNHPDIIIANRTFSKASELADKYSGTALELSSVESAISGCEIIITATSSKKYLITKKMAAKAMTARGNKTQAYIDLSVPSNVEENVKEIENVLYYGIDDLKEVVAKNVEYRKSAIQQSNTIIKEMQNEFMEWFHIQNLKPTIITIKENLKNIQKTELEGFIKARKIKESDLIEQYSEHISEKYIRLFIKRLKKVTNNGKQHEYIKIINNLFDSDENE